MLVESLGPAQVIMDESQLESEGVDDDEMADEEEDDEVSDESMEEEEEEEVRVIPLNRSGSVGRKFWNLHNQHTFLMVYFGM